MLAAPVKVLPPLEGYAAEIKWDGVRACLLRASESVQLVSRHGTPLATSFPDIVACPPP
ncbi:hypothetical protein AB8O64_02855 [Streptomyces sp. QH1-20]|uniref:ATP-dependent DNA ligase n=1 Tax=Streptomyces sp. QH1-20 TaxID=3240934 RepID=UPI0035186D47